LICASLSALRPLATKYFPALFAQFSQATGSPSTIKNSQNRPVFEMISPTASQGSEGIYVHKTFDVLELSQLPATPRRARIKSVDIYAGRTLFEDRSSEDELVVAS
jgi:hypothetical protein